MKLARNRESARNSRKRKKIYIELLEAKVRDMLKSSSQRRDFIRLVNKDKMIVSGIEYHRRTGEDEASIGNEHAIPK